jgi:hypothetical protein
MPPTAPQLPSSIIRGWYNRPVVATVASGLTPTENNNNTVQILMSDLLNSSSWSQCVTSNIVLRENVAFIFRVGDYAKQACCLLGLIFNPESRSDMIPELRASL